MLRTEWLFDHVPFGRPLGPELAEGLRAEHNDRAIEVGCADPDGDEGKHVQVARLKRAPAAFEKRPPGPENNGGAKNELDPARGVTHEPGVRVRQKMGHGQEKDRQSQGRADPETAGHIAQLGIIFGGHG